MADKGLTGIVNEIAQAGVAQVFVTALDHPRSAAPERIAEALAAQAPEIGFSMHPASAAAFAAASAAARPGDLLCVAGSVALAGEALRWFQGQPGMN